MYLPFKMSLPNNPKKDGNSASFSKSLQIFENVIS